MNVGDKVPDLLGLDQNGKELRRSDFPGKTIALYFYPKDSTSGCTAQACNLRDNYQELLNAGYQVIGVSVDSEKSHQKFMGTFRTTFIIDPEGTITRIITPKEVKTKDHSNQILNA